jgi:hypothetical protein
MQLRGARLRFFKEKRDLGLIETSLSQKYAMTSYQQQQHSIKENINITTHSSSVVNKKLATTYYNATNPLESNGDEEC